MSPYLREPSILGAMGLVTIGLALGWPALRQPPGWGLVALGIVIFLGFEYGMHRFMLHAPRSRHAAIARLQHRLHYGHHERPSELALLWAPLWMSIPVAAPNFVIYLLVSRSLSVSCAILAGNFLGLLYYEYVHYTAHVPRSPRTPWGRYMKKMHLWHHFKNEHYWFGVTNPVIDHLVGSYRRPEDVEVSPTARQLYPPTDWARGA